MDGAGGYSMLKTLVRVAAPCASDEGPSSRCCMRTCMRRWLRSLRRISKSTASSSLGAQCTDGSRKNICAHTHMVMVRLIPDGGMTMTNHQRQAGAAPKMSSCAQLTKVVGLQ